MKSENQAKAFVREVLIELEYNRFKFPFMFVVLICEAKICKDEFPPIVLIHFLHWAKPANLF